MLSKTTTQEPCLLRARATLLRPATDGTEASTWVTGRSFDDLRSDIAKAFSGIPGKANGEPISNWMLADFRRDSKVKDDLITFIVSSNLYQTMSRLKFLDISIRTADGEALASTAVLVEYRTPWSALGRWWDLLSTNWHEYVLMFKLWRQGSLPEAVVSRKEWKNELKSLSRRTRIAMDALAELHEQHGPRHRHWYVDFVASDPNRQGQGYGSKILQKICELADSEKVDCFLDCGLEKNKSFYERFGFVVVASRVLGSGSDEDEAAAEKLTVFGMVRTFNA